MSPQRYTNSSPLEPVNVTVGKRVFTPVVKLKGDEVTLHGRRGLVE
jgi:hypothetical protein